MASVGILGGTFDPIHFGHLITAQAVLEIRKLEKIIFVPCNISPHKLHNYSSQAFDRLEMIKLAIEYYPQFTYTDFEIQKGDVSYTIDTIKEMRKSYAEIELIIGYDNIIKFDTWHEPDKILQLAELIVLKRRHDQQVKQFHKYYGEAIYVDTPIVEISSSNIRNRVHSGRSIDFLVPQKVKEYIYKSGLYKN